MTFEQLRQNVEDTIESVYGKQESKAISRVLMLHYTATEPAAYQLIKHQPASAELADMMLNHAIPLLLKHTPVQYITGQAWLGGLCFSVKEGVLIPRPETEEMVCKIIENMGHEVASDTAMMDIGTGSGVIAVSLAKKWNNALVYALDISTEALETAKINAKNHNVDINLLQGDILEENFRNSLPQDLSLIVSNPPYVRESEKIMMMPNVLLHEPALALFVPDNDALVFYRHIAGFARKHLKPGGKLWLEINEYLSAQTVGLLQKQGFLKVEAHKDFRGKYRFVSSINK
ncbi:peptide chain release factor N(5)-glutamine methyltransferase [Lentimicrobium sp.]